MYLLGLFHDGGIPLMVQHFKQYRDAITEHHNLGHLLKDNSKAGGPLVGQSWKNR